LAKAAAMGDCNVSFPLLWDLQVQGPASLVVLHKQRRCFRKGLEHQPAAPAGAPGRRRRRESHEHSPPLLLKRWDFSSSSADEALKLFNLRSVIRSLITVMPKGLQ